MNRSIILILSFFYLMLSACAVKYESAVDKYRNSKVCCQNISRFEYLKFSDQGSYISDINEDSPLFNFNTGKSYFIGLELPSFKQRYQIIVKSYALGENLDQSHIFFPQVLLLDKNYSVLNSSQENSLYVSRASFTETAKENKWGLPVKLEGFITIDDPKIKYMVILTTKKLLAGTTSYQVLRSTPVILPDVVGSLPLYEELIEIPHSPFGRIVVKIVD